MIDSRGQEKALVLETLSNRVFSLDDHLLLLINIKTPNLTIA